MIELQARKNKDYGNAFGKSMDKFGPVVSLIRLGDKMNRLEHLVMNGGMKVKDESVEDTLVDLAAYAIMTVEWLNNRK